MPGQAGVDSAGRREVSTVLDNMKNSTGATEAAFQTMTESAKFQIDKIKANIEGIETQLCNSIHACNERYSHVNSGDDRRDRRGS